MVTIAKYEKRQNKDEKDFFVLILEGEMEIIRSQVTGKNYATAKRASISSTFSEETCQKLVGQQIPGSIQKIAAEPYDYVIKETGEVLTLTHQYVFCKEGELAEEMVVPSEKVAMPVI